MTPMHVTLFAFCRFRIGSRSRSDLLLNGVELVVNSINGTNGHETISEGIHQKP